MSDSESEEVSLETQFEPRDDDSETLWEVEEITAERKNAYRVRWAGVDPKTKKPWPQSWVEKHDCTDDLVIAWKKKKRRQEEEKEARQKATKTKKAAKGKGKEKEQNGKGKEKERVASSSRVTRSSGSNSSPVPVPPPRKVGPPRLHKRKRVAAMDAEDRRSQSPEEYSDGTSRPGPSRPTKRPRAESPEAPAMSPRAYVGNRSGSSSPSQDIPYQQSNAEEDQLPDEPITPPKSRSRSRSRSRSQDRSNSREELRTGRNDDLVRGKALSTDKDNRSKPNENARARGKERPMVAPAPKKVLGPVPVVSPSVFRPYLPAPPRPATQDTIEEFSSPERHPRQTGARKPKKNISRSQLVSKKSTAAQTGKEPPLSNGSDSDGGRKSPEDAEAVVRTMEEDFIDMTGGFTSPAHGVEDIDTSGQTDEQAQENWEADQDNANVFNLTTSTQQAVADSQSQKWGRVALNDLKPQAVLSQDSNSSRQQDSQVTELRAQLQSSHAAFALVQNDLRVRDEELTEVKATLKSRDSSLAQCRTQVRMQEEAIASLQREVKKLRARETELTVEVQTVTTKQDSLAAQLDDYRVQNEELIANKEELQGEVDDLCEEVLALRRRNVALEDAHPSPEDEDEGYSDSSSAHLPNHKPSAAVSLLDKLQLSEKRVAELEAQASEWRTDGLATIRETFEEHVRRLEGEVAQWRGLCGILRKKDERTDDDIRRRAGEEPELRNRLEKLREEHAALELEQAQLQQELSELETECERVAAERLRLLTEKEEWVDEVSDLTLKNEALEQDKAVWEDDRTRLQEALELKAAEKARQDKKIAALVASNEGLRTSLSKANADHVDLTRRVRTAEDEKRKVDELLQLKTDELATLTTENGSLQTQLDVSRTEDGALQSSLDALRAEHLALQTEETSCKAQVERLREQIVSLERDLNEARTARDRLVQEYQAQIDTLTSSLTRVQDELKNLGSEISRTAKEKDDLESELGRFATQREQVHGIIGLLEKYKDKLEDITLSVSSPSPAEIAPLLDEYAAHSPRPLTLATLLSFGRPVTPESVLESVGYVLTEVPRLFGWRVRAFEGLPFIVGVNPFIARILAAHRNSFKLIANYPQVKTLEDNKIFTSQLEALVRAHTNDIPIMAKGFQECSKYLSPEETTTFLDAAIRNRISVRLLAEQHIAISRDLESQSPSGDHIGVVHLRCSPASMIRMCASFVAELCEATLGTAPEITIDGDVDATFAYVPVHLEYILTEILKNAFRASVERHRSSSSRSSTPPPVRITIAPPPPLSPSSPNPSSSTSSPNIRPAVLALRIRDEGGGVSPAHVPHIFSYSFTTARRLSNANNYQDEPDDDDLGPYAAQSVGGIAGMYSTTGHVARGSNDSYDSALGPKGGSSLFADLVSRGAAHGMGGTIAGLGYGLPLSRLYTMYFGGSLEFVSLDGWGQSINITPGWLKILMASLQEVTCL
ncbi:hypothetical protein EIP86_011525 [Pleurotus ostreatoroseus]|nr:hypothetical protein EIP86_011525 [Pleurotus ostreatoroseus]